ncbi:hypothetical protein G4V39_01385 [Thermosulfuriphilus ammonigenes]|uniref:Uncharacterized protein n=1 Tax=Thermosulfuriphilus ammonigenes TaxID=1936021 RepID=A0A6G7PTW9_9BACT|nr:hypothetical protein [Thermosulfuriphilus ammonigenes]MBA2848875.1 hypothetical protein [Thermosulfuriphilus ammonigenes]QIJ71006.1 hypothetical protein G4V39_01385 [Thermosulfuriphilus ammonigenes]HFB84021.1 hypothetical protein [Thermodesulfatator sp.]
MRQYLIDELKTEEVKRIREQLERYCEPSPMEGLYWLPVPDDLLAEIQCQHPQCRPYYFSIELGERFVKFELLIRSRVNLRCSCIAYANRAQRDFLFHFADKILEEARVTI